MAGDGANRANAFTIGKRNAGYMFFDFIQQHFKHHVASLYRQIDLKTLADKLKPEVVHTWCIQNDLPRAVHYFLEVDQVSELRDLELDETAFPRVPHPLTFIEFDGRLHYDYDHVLNVVDKESLRTGLAFAEPVPGGSDYRGVLLRDQSSRLLAASASREATVSAPYTLSADWFTKEGYTFTIVMDTKDWPKTQFGSGYRQENEPPGWADKEIAQTKRLYHASVNLCHFLMSENVTFVKIRPEHRQKYGAELKSLPKSDRPYYITSIHAPRYRYLQRSAPTGRHVSVRFDVRAHFRHLRSDRFSRDEKGDMRTIWIGSHQRGLTADVYRPKLRVGHIGAHLLNYDDFVRELEANKNDRARRQSHAASGAGNDAATSNHES